MSQITEAVVARMKEVAAEAGSLDQSLAGLIAVEFSIPERSVIEAAGFGPYFIHRTGHGLGLEVHEPPNMVAGNEEPLVDGEVFTIEPGIYIPDMGGVRIEDDILITSSGSESLTTITRELIQVG